MRNAAQAILNAEGFNAGIVDKSSPNYSSIRGREQQVMDANGGAPSSEGYSRNKINGVNAWARPVFEAIATREFDDVVRTGECTCNK